MSDQDNGLARYQRPPRKGQFKPGQSGKPRGRPKGSKNIRTCVQDLLDARIAVKESGKTRMMPRSEAIAIQLVNLASKGDPKGLASRLASTPRRCATTSSPSSIAPSANSIRRPASCSRPTSSSWLRFSKTAEGARSDA